jgi:hypothetical protein
VVAGPLYTIVGLIQMFIRPGYDIRRHALSLLSNGDLRWIQVANFEVSGLLVIAGALGMRRVLRDSRGGTWEPLLLGIYGLSLIGAGIFSAFHWRTSESSDTTPYSHHPFAYALSNPILLTDPSGRCSRTGDDYCFPDADVQSGGGIAPIVSPPGIGVDGPLQPNPFPTVPKPGPMTMPEAPPAAVPGTVAAGEEAIAAAEVVGGGPALWVIVGLVACAALLGGDAPVARPSAGSRRLGSAAGQCACPWR